MNVSLIPEEERGDPGRATLGDLLYANPAKVCVPETEWIAWVQAIAAGDQIALYTVYGRMHRVVFTYILRIVKSRETAEELTVDVFHQVWLRAASYDAAGGTVVGWIMNQARSRAIDRLRFEGRQKRTRSQALIAEESVEDDSERVVEVRNQQRRLSDALASLTRDEREAIETAFLSECTHIETAARLGAPLGTIKTRIRLGLAKLRRALVTS